MHILLMKTLLMLMALALISSGSNIPKHRPIDVHLNDNVTLECSFDYPVACAWQRNSTYFIITGRYILPHAAKSDQKLRNCSLLIKNVSKIDNTTWKCINQASSSNSGNETREEYWINVKMEKPILSITTTLATIFSSTFTSQQSIFIRIPATAPVTTAPANLEPHSSVKTQTESVIDENKSEIPIAILIASATSGGILALIVLLGLTIFACYRCKKPNRQPHIMPIKYYAEVNTTSTNTAQYSNVCLRDSYGPQSTSIDFNDGYLMPIQLNTEINKSNKKRSSNISKDSSHFYEEIPTNFMAHSQ